jgi:hypothetical protein
MEVTFDPAGLHAGGVVTGAVSATNVHPRTRRLAASLVGVDRATFRSGRREAEVRRYEWTLCEGAPADGTSIPFRLEMPKDELPTFQAHLLGLAWALEIKADIGMARDPVLWIPVTFAPCGTKDGGRERMRKLPPIGHERRAKAWKRVAKRFGLTNDAEHETMTGQIGAVDVRIELEQRESGLHSVALLKWPSVGLGLSITERRWTDRLKGSRLEIGNAPFADRFTVRGREAAQVKTFVRRSVREALLRLPEALLGDDEAELAAPGGAQVASTLESFAEASLSLATAVDRALGKVAPPVAMRRHVEAWTAFATRTGGRLEIGSMSVRGIGTTGGVPFDIETRWDDEGAPSLTWIGHVFDASRDRRAPPAPLVTEARAMSSSFQYTPEAVFATLEAPVADPRSAEPLVMMLGRIASAVYGVSDRGPYRSVLPGV